jgi:outer membrane protein assembly factor BamB
VTAFGQVSVVTQHNDNYRTGANLGETILKPGNVAPRRFGRIFSRDVDGTIYAQPLYVPNVTITGKGTHNVVFVATLHNTVYAFDADDKNAVEPLWSRNLGTSVPVPNPYFGNRYGPYGDVNPEIGIVGTPVINPATNSLYVVAFTQDKEGGPYQQRLNVLDIRDGSNRLPAVRIAGGVKGSGDGSQNGQLQFDPMQHMQRPGLLLSGGKLWIAFASHADTDPYHGWVFTYDPVTLKRQSVFCTTPDGNEGGIWMAGQGLHTDAQGNVYAMVGNGSFDGLRNYGDSFIKFSPKGTLVDFFTPFNARWMEIVDADLGSAGSIYIPGTDIITGGGKEGKLYQIDRRYMGKFQVNDDGQIMSSFRATNGFFTSPVFYKGSFGAYLYIHGYGDVLKGFRLSNGIFNSNPMMAAENVRWPGGGLSISANGAKANTAIVWDLGLQSNSSTGILRAYDAATLKLLWSSDARQDDDLGSGTKFAVPTVANGKVYVPTSSKALVVYGLLK